MVLPLMFIFVLMCERKAWTKEEDDLLRDIMLQEEQNQGNRKLRWNDIAARISSLGCKTPRKGKQCRQRWFNQLHPSIVKEQNWLPEEEITLFSLQEKYGNHWAKISKGLPGRSDNAIKNYFYSCLRKALRKVNNYVYNNKRMARYKNIKPFQKTTLSKILSVAENKAENKISIAKEDAPLLAKEIKKLLLDIQIFKRDQDDEQISDTMSEVIAKIQQFNRICKRKKTKKKTIPQKEHSLRQPLLSSEDLFSKQPSELPSEEDDRLSSEKIPVDGYQQRKQLQIQLGQKSQALKQEPEGNSHKFSTSESLDQVKKMKNEVLIPSCKYNCQHSQKVNCSKPEKEVPLHNPSLASTQKINNLNQAANKPFLPYLPFFTSHYYHADLFMPKFFPNQLQRSIHPTPGMPYPYSQSSFNLCQEWMNLQRMNPFYSGSRQSQRPQHKSGKERQ